MINALGKQWHVEVSSAFNADIMLFERKDSLVRLVGPREIPRESTLEIVGACDDRLLCLSSISAVPAALALSTATSTTKIKV